MHMKIAVNFDEEGSLTNSENITAIIFYYFRNLLGEDISETMAASIVETKRPCSSEPPPQKKGRLEGN